MFTDPKRQRPPLQPQSGSNSSAYHHPSTEIALQQQMLRQQHSGGHSPMGSGSLFESLGQHNTDASQLQMHSQTTGLLSGFFLPAGITGCLGGVTQQPVWVCDAACVCMCALPHNWPALTLVSFCTAHTHRTVHMHSMAQHSTAQHSTFVCMLAQ